MTFRVANVLHRVLQGMTRGRLGWQVADMPVLRLVTTGRRTGRPHAVMLTAPLGGGDPLVVVASRGGDDRSPAWLLNLREHPAVEVELGGAPARPMLAREVGPEERERLWSRVVQAQPRYGGYQARTTRTIPLVVLEPRP